MGKSTVEARVGIGPNDCGSGFMRAAALHVTLRGANAEAAKDVVRGAHTVCPYSNAARNNINVKLRVRRATETNTTSQPNIRNQT
jgi:osmotically inducible protein OsmC